MAKHIYNLKKQPFDATDKKFTRFMQVQPGVILPGSTNNRNSPFNPPIFDQMNLGSCTGNAYVRAIMILKQYTTLLSRLDLYWNETAIEGDPGQDNGANMRTGWVAAQTRGVCEEGYWPYSDDPNNFAQGPTPEAEQNALQHKIGGGFAPQSVMEIKQVMALKGQPICAGIPIYDSFESDRVTATGEVPLPDTANENLLGYHAVCMLDYDDGYDWFIVANSWGRSWGADGYFFLPYEFINKMSPDLWGLRL